MNGRFRFDPASAAAAAEAVVPEDLLINPIIRPGLTPDRIRTVPLELVDPIPSEQIFVPDGYEANYPYPLIIWALPPEAGRLELQRLMMQVSHRNYLGLAFRVEANEMAACESGNGVDEVLEGTSARLMQTVRRLRRMYHVHSERVYLAGFGSAGTLALALSLARPEWIAGVAALGSGMPEVPHLLARLDDLRGKRVFLGSGQRDRKAPPTEASRLSRLLQSAGMRVCHRLYEAGHELTRPMLVELDRWVMKDIYETVEV